MTSFVCLYVVKDLQTSEIAYVPKEMEGERLPDNTPEDICALVLTANEDEIDKYIKYMDVFGIVTQDGTTWWEMEDGT